MLRGEIDSRTIYRLERRGMTNRKKWEIGATYFRATVLDKYFRRSKDCTIGKMIFPLIYFQTLLKNNDGNNSLTL